MKSVNGAIFHAFLGLARAHGSTPIIVYFPTRLDFASPQQGWTRVAREVFQTYGIPLLDMTNCVSQISPAERFVILHYSSVTNVAVAKCLRDAIGEASQR
jgi:hypothetical protein